LQNAIYSFSVSFITVAVFTGCRYYLLPFFPLPFLPLPILPLPFLPRIATRPKSLVLD